MPEEVMPLIKLDPRIYKTGCPHCGEEVGTASDVEIGAKMQRDADQKWLEAKSGRSCWRESEMSKRTDLKDSTKADNPASVTSFTRATNGSKMPEVMPQRIAGLTRKEFIALPMEERHRRLKEQAEKFVAEHGYLSDDPCDGHSTMIPSAGKEVMPLITDDIVAEVEKIFKDNVERDSEFIMNTARQLQLMRIAYRKGKLNQRDADQKWRKVQHNLNLKFFKERVEAIHAFYKRYLETKEKEARLQGITECANQVEELLAAGIFNEAAITVNLSSVLNYIASHPEQIHNVPPLTQLRQIAEGK